MIAPNAPDAGFSLIEALVAAAVLAVAAAGLIGATGAHVDLVAALEARAAGRLAADNALVEARLGVAPARASLLGSDWSPAVTARPGGDPAITALTVSAASRGTRVTLTGFRAAEASDAPRR